MEDMEEITFAGQKYYFTEELVKLWQERLVLEIFEQNYFTEKEYSKFIFEYGKDVYVIPKFSGLTYDMVSNMIKNGEDGLEKFYNENVEIEENKRKINFLGIIFDLNFPIDDKVKKAFKEQAIAYFKKRFFPETEEDFKFLAEFVLPMVFCKLYNELKKIENRIKLINARKKELEDKLKEKKEEKKELNLKDEDETKIYIDIQDMLLQLEQANLEKNNIFHELIFCLKKFNILGRFGIDEFNFSKLELGLQIKFLTLISIYKKLESINFIIIFFNMTLFTDSEKNIFVEAICNKFYEKSENGNLVLKSNVSTQHEINQITNEVIFDVIKYKFFYPHAKNRGNFIFGLRILKENFSKDENSNLSFENKGYFAKNSLRREVYTKYSPVEMINLVLFVYEHSPDILKASETYEKLKENVEKNDTLTIEILSKQMVNTFENCMNLNQRKDIETLKKIIFRKEKEIENYIYEEVNLKDRVKHITALDKAFIIISEKIDYEYKIELMAKNLTEILLKGTESEKILQQKEQIIFANAQEIFYDVYNVKMGDDERKKYRKALAKAMDLAEAKIYTEYFIDDFRKYTSKRWWQREKTMEEKLKIVNDIYTNSVEGKSEMQIEVLTQAKRIVTNELLSKEYERLNEETNEFAMNNSQTSEEIFDLGEKLDKDINSSSQPENVKKSLLEKVNDIGQEKFENISPQQINSDFKFFTNH